MAACSLFKIKEKRIRIQQVFPLFLIIVFLPLIVPFTQSPVSPSFFDNTTSFFSDKTVKMGGSNRPSRKGWNRTG